MLLFTDIDAVNDDSFNHKRHRTSAIFESVASIANYPTKLRIYLTNASPYWQVRCFIKGRTYTKSLRTTSRRVAVRGAKDFFHRTVAEIYGSTIIEREDKELLFKDLVQPTIAIEQSRASRGELSKLGLTILQNRLHKTVLPHFSEMPVSKIGYNEIADFIHKLSNQNSSPTTIQQYLVATRKVLSHAYANNLIKHVPKFPSVKIHSQARGSFTLLEYKTLVKTSKSEIGNHIDALTKTQKKRGRFLVSDYTLVTNELQWVIRFMVNSFIRPTDLKNLQHQHVTVVRGQHTYLRLNLPESKKHDKPIVTLQGAVFVYEKLLEYHKKNNRAEPTDYLFMPTLRDRTHLLLYLGWQFMYVQKLAKIEKNASNGMNRTLYSLRHTAITFRLLYGGNIDLLTLARNARTSVEMVEKFYSSNLSSEMNIDLLQGKRKKT